MRARTPHSRAGTKAQVMVSGSKPPLDGCAQLWLRADLSGGFLSLTDTCRPQMCNHVRYILGKREHHLNSEELQM